MKSFCYRRRRQLVETECMLIAGFNQFQKKGAGGRVVKSAAPPAATDSGSLNPTFELEDFIQFHDGRLKTSTGDVLQNDNVSGFDLNADPASDQMDV
ncbi:hypothetical protein L1987_12108 [Smallanthus sonchifolius]|uniref:Uncharacterized protein n=1 Tax=Smallanthus sonchifolius TaxID=185202 RepID=A0ACB9JCV0_9ASTR|nr:hypothetical protein L1987_12108 [Smallanthus sonchifolius]